MWVFLFFFFFYTADFRSVDSHSPYKTYLKISAQICVCDTYTCISLYHSPTPPLGIPGMEKALEQGTRTERCCWPAAGLEPSPGCWAVCHAALSAAPGGSPWGFSASPPAARPPPWCAPCPPAAGFHCARRVRTRPPPSALFPPACSGATEMTMKFTHPAGLYKDPFSCQNPTLPQFFAKRICLHVFFLLFWQTWRVIRFLEIPWAS